MKCTLGTMRTENTLQNKSPNNKSKKHKTKEHVTHIFSYSLQAIIVSNVTFVLINNFTNKVFDK